MQPKISVIVPVYNCERYIRRCFESIRNQSLTEIEIIFVNDGSTDSTANILNEFSRVEQRLSVIHQENQGTGGARNTGIRRAKGKFICFMDSDDTAEPNMLARLFEKACEEIDVVICGFNEVSESGSIIKHTHGMKVNKESYLKSILTFKNASSVWAKIFRTELFRNKMCLFPVGLRNNEDNALLYKLLYFARNISFVSDFLYNWNRGIDTKSRNISKLRIQETIDVLHQRKVFLQSHSIFKSNVEEYYKGVVYTLNLRKSQIDRVVNSVERIEYIKWLYTCVFVRSLIDKEVLLLIREKNIFDYWRLVFFAANSECGSALSKYKQCIDKSDWANAIKCSQTESPPEINSLKYYYLKYSDQITYIYGVGDIWLSLQKQLSPSIKIAGFIDQKFQGRCDNLYFDLETAMQLMPSGSVLLIASIAHSQYIVKKIQSHHLYNKRKPTLLTYAGVFVA